MVQSASSKEKVRKAQGFANRPPNDILAKGRGGELGEAGQRE